MRSISSHLSLSPALPDCANSCCANSQHTAAAAATTAAAGNDTAGNRIRRRGGFTLIEILVVIAILGILMGLIANIIPMVLKTVNKRRTISMFSQWATALDQYRSTYSTYPNLNNASSSGSGDNQAIQLNEKETVKRFVFALSGRTCDGSEVDSNLSKNNRRRKNFCDFPNDWFIDKNPQGTGEHGGPFLVDHLDNKNIYVATDTNLDGKLDQNALSNCLIDTSSYDEFNLNLNQDNSLNARVYIATLKKDSDEEGDYMDICYFQ